MFRETAGRTGARSQFCCLLNRGGGMRVVIALGQLLRGSKRGWDAVGFLTLADFRLDAASYWRTA